MNTIVINIWFDVCAMFILLVILISFYSRNNVPFLQNRVFLVMVWLNFLSTLMDLLTGVWHNYIDLISIHCGVWTNWMLNLLYFTARNMTTVWYLLYIKATLNIERSSLVKSLQLSLPLLVDLILIAVTPFTGAVFYIDGMGYYHRGPLIWVLYAIAVYYMTLAVWTIIYYRKLIPSQRRIAFLFFIGVGLLSVAVQGLYQELAVEGFGTAICILMIYLTIQKPEDLQDGTTGFMNKKMFANICSVWMKQKTPFHVIYLQFKDYMFLEKFYGVEVAEQLMEKAALYLRRFSKLFFFRIADDKLCLASSKKESVFMEKIMAEINGRFLKSWSAQEYDIMLFARSGLFSFPEDVGNYTELTALLDAITLSPQQENGKETDVRKLDLAAINRRNKIEGIVKLAIDKQALEVVYQPIYSIKEDRFCAAEALLRLHDEELGNISPAEFIPIAEKNGAIVRLGQYVMETVCRFITEKSLKSFGVDYIEINLSTVEFLQDNLVKNTMQSIRKYGVEGNQINLEITETAMSTLPENVEGKMKKLLENGFTFSLDDYGTGYSNISRMIALPFHIIKIDKSIIQEAFQSDSMQVVLDSTLQMIQKLGKKVLAEGIETKEQADYLKKMGCDYIQGYYYSRPLKKEDFLKLLQS